MSWAVTGAAAIGGAASLGAAALAPKGGGVGPSVVNLPTFDFFEPGAKEASDFQRAQLATLAQGQFPQFFQNAIPQLRQELTSPLIERFFGREGERGGSILDSATAVGSLTGVGGRSTTANVNKTLRDFATRAQSIDRFITQQGVDLTKNFAQSIPRSLATEIPQGPPATAFGGFGQAAGTSGASDAISSIGDVFGKFVGGGGLNPKPTPTPTPIPLPFSSPTPARQPLSGALDDTGGLGFFR
jgi:hypothetical protein